MKSVIYGAGSIGRGFIGQLFSESDFEVVFIDQNKELIDQLNGRKSYPLSLIHISLLHERGKERIGRYFCAYRRSGGISLGR